MRLKYLQRRFWQLITAPEGVAAGLGAEMPTPRKDGNQRDAEGLLEWIRAPDAAQALERLDIYANMYFHRQHDVLADDYPAVLKHLGAPAFNNIVVDYLLAHPASHPSLRHLGDDFAGFLSTHPLGASDVQAVALARFEFARTWVFDRPSSARMQRHDLAQVKAAAWPRARLVVQPALTSLQLPHGTVARWQNLVHNNAAAQARPLSKPAAQSVGTQRTPRRASSERTPGSERRPGSENVVVWRDANDRIWHQRITEGELRALAAAQTNQPAAEIFEQLLLGSTPHPREQPRLETPRQAADAGALEGPKAVEPIEQADPIGATPEPGDISRAFACLSRWVDQGWLCDVVTVPATEVSRGRVLSPADGDARNRQG